MHVEIRVFKPQTLAAFRDNSILSGITGSGKSETPVPRLESPENCCECFSACRGYKLERLQDSVDSLARRDGPI